MTKIEKTKKQILEFLENKRITHIKVSFKGRLEIFILKWKVLRKFPDYSLKEELKELFYPKKLEVLLK